MLLLVLELGEGVQRAFVLGVALEKLGQVGAPRLAIPGLAEELSQAQLERSVARRRCARGFAFERLHEVLLVVGAALLKGSLEVDHRICAPAHGLVERGPLTVERRVSGAIAKAALTALAAASSSSIFR